MSVPDNFGAPAPNADLTPEGSRAPGANKAASRARRIALKLGVALVGLAAFYGAVWAYLAGRFADGVAVFLAGQSRDGMAVAHAGLVLGGFPGRIEARILAPSATIAFQGRVWTWRPERATFSARPWSLNRVSVDLSGAHAIVPADASGLARWTATAETLVLAARLEGATVRALDLTAIRLAVIGRRPGGEFGTTGLRLRWRIADIPPADHRGASQWFDFEAEGVRPPEGARLALADVIARIAVAGEVRGRLAPGEAADAVARWRDDGGTIELSRIEGRFGALALAGEGTLALDGAFQPVGAFTARVEGYAEALDALRDAGALSGGNALAAKVTLTALARREGNGRPYLSLPISLQERRLYVGPVALLTVPALSW
jgi:hypothetical protein